MTLARTNLTLPEDVIREVDAIAGPRGRSRYVAEAVTQRLQRDRLRKAVEDSAGVLLGPNAMNRDQVTDWIDQLRTEDPD